MALDGIFLYKLKNELNDNILGLRVDKVNQPSKDEIVLSLRERGCNYKLLISVRADSPRVHLTSRSISNPLNPPMFCMLLRKYLTGGEIVAVRQKGMDRIIFIDFDARNEIGDKISLTLSVEIMGKHSNLILISDGRVVDSIKRVDYSVSSVRQVLPGIEYKLPPSQDKLNLEIDDIDDILERLGKFSQKSLSSALLASVEGLSPLAAREIESRAFLEDETFESLSDIQRSALKYELSDIKKTIGDHSEFYVLSDENKKPKDFSFFEIKQYSGKYTTQKYETASELLDDFYYERDRISRVSHRAHELLKLIQNTVERTERKILLQKQELKDCENRETYKLYGELIVANLYKLQKGVSFYEVENYYDNYNKIKIPCDLALTPAENQKKYYKEYRKAQTAEKMLTSLIEKGSEEVRYLESVLDEISRADSDFEISEIRSELQKEGYLKSVKEKKQKLKRELPFLEFESDDGFRILAGRNNIQNDKLSLKTAGKFDLWLHTQNTPGSHVVIFSDGKEISDLAIEQGAVIAASLSKASESSLVPVDYTYAKELKKPTGAKAGMVIYHTYYTIIVKPDLKFIERVKKN